MAVYRSSLYPDYPDVTTIGTLFELIGTASSEGSLIGRKLEISNGDIAVFYINNDDDEYVWYIVVPSSTEPFQYRTCIVYEDREEWSDWTSVSTPVEIQGHEIYAFSTSSAVKKPLTSTQPSGTILDDLQSITNTVVGFIRWYGTAQGTSVSIPVEWHSKYREEPYTATLTITVSDE